MAYAADVFYRSLNGVRPNNDLDQLTVSLQLKDQVTPKDCAYFQAVYYRATAGDLRQYYSQTDASPSLRTKETQESLLIAGWHHEWTPQGHISFLTALLQHSFTSPNAAQPVINRARHTNGTFLKSQQDTVR